MAGHDYTPRKRDDEVDAMFIDRWSPRAFSSEPIDKQHVEMLIEAARWAPSAYNEQPWRFVYAITDNDRKRFVSALVEQNQSWAAAAPVLMFIFAKKLFARDGSVNKWAQFDTGAAWMSLALQARKLGFYTHAMAGFDPSKVYQITNVSSEQYEIIAAVAVGKRADAADLPEPLKPYENPTPRKPVKELLL
jgi:nitroreductase